jgi:hypothetical protein
MFTELKEAWGDDAEKNVHFPDFTADRAVGLTAKNIAKARRALTFRRSNLQM